MRRAAAASDTEAAGDPPESPVSQVAVAAIPLVAKRSVLRSSYYADGGGSDPALTDYFRSQRTRSQYGAVPSLVRNRNFNAQLNRDGGGSSSNASYSSIR